MTYRYRVLLIPLLLFMSDCASHRSFGQDNPEKNAPPKAKQEPLAVRCLAFSPDGKSLAAGYGRNEGPGRLIAWDVDQQKPRFVKNEDTIVPTVAYSPDGEILAAGSFTPKLRLLDPTTGEIRGEFTGHEHHVRSVVFNPTGSHIASGSYDRTIKLWELEKGEVVRVFKGPKTPLRVIAISPDGKWLAAACGDEGVARLWNLESKSDAEVPREFRLSGFTPQVAFSPDSHTLAIACWVAGPILIDVASGEETARFTQMGGIHWISYSPDGRWLAVATNSKDLYVFPAQQAPNEDERREVAQLIEQFNDDDYAKREAASRQLAQRAAVALPQLRAGLKSDSAEVRVRCRRLLEQTQSGGFARKLPGHADELECLAFSKNGKYLASGDWQGEITLWDVEMWKPLATLSQETE